MLYKTKYSIFRIITLIVLDVHIFRNLIIMRIETFRLCSHEESDLPVYSILAVSVLFASRAQNYCSFKGENDIFP